jgi:hypothetical protein
MKRDSDLGQRLTPDKRYDKQDQEMTANINKINKITRKMIIRNKDKDAIP